MRNNVKKPSSSIRIKKPAGGKPAGPGALPGGDVFLAGLWAGVWQWLHPAGSLVPAVLPIAAAVTALCLGLLVRWEKPGRLTALAAVLAAWLAWAVLCRNRLTAAAAALGNLAISRLLLQTGRYHLPYSGGGSVWPLVLTLAVLTGGVTALALRRRWPGFCLAAGLAALALRLLGLLEGGWPLAVLLVGGLMCLLPRQGLGRQAMLAGLSLFVAAFCALVPLIPGLVPAQGNGVFLHRLRYESHPSPLPEGDLTRPHGSGSQTALTVTMDRWEPLYLRGFAAGEYTGRSWQPLEGEALAAQADALYTLQRDYFFPSTQVSAAWQDVSGGESRTVTVANAGACRQRLYLPYGAATDALDAADLAGEGGRVPADAVTLSVYPVEDSYLLQDALSRSGDDTPYRQGEAVYRQWVYDHYLTVPQSTYEALTRAFTPESDMTTTQAKAAVLAWLSQSVSYRQGASVSGGDIAAAMASGGQQGSDIHYATLAALLLRCCGVPARYAEGYVVTRQQAEAMVPGGTLTLTEQSSHAWTEYYLDGVGWLPFDAAPGYTDLVEYRLPENGPEGENGQGDTPVPDTPVQEREPEVVPEEEQPRDRRAEYVRNALLTLAAVLALGLLALTVRALLGRRRLRQAAARYQDPDCRMGCGYILCAVHDLLGQPGLPEDPLSPEDAEDLVYLERGVWYSGHTMTEDQRRRCLALLESARRVWREQTPALRRFAARFITCKVF